jgi:hypothetical protein
MLFPYGGGCTHERSFGIGDPYHEAGGRYEPLIIAIMIVCLIAHEATAIWDVSYA